MRLVLALFTVALLLAGCASNDQAGGAASPPPASPFVGYWQGHTKNTGNELLFQVDQQGDEFHVGARGWQPWPVPMQDGRLVIHRYGDEPAAWQYGEGPLAFYGLELAHDGDRVVAEILGKNGLFERVPLRSVSAASYEAKTDAWADSSSPATALALYVGIQKWQRRHDGLPPEPSQLKPSSDFAAWLTAHTPFTWPTNPYTGEPVAVGSGLGDVTYTTSGKTFTLVDHLSGGKTYTAS